MDTSEQNEQLAQALAAIEAAADGDALEAQRIAALGKQGWVSAALKTLGSMSPEERQSQGPRIQGLRAAISEAIERRKADLETASYAAANASLSEVLQAFLGLAETRVDALDREAAVVRDAVRINLTYGAGEP